MKSMRNVVHSELNFSSLYHRFLAFLPLTLSVLCLVVAAARQVLKRERETLCHTRPNNNNNDTVAGSPNYEIMTTSQPFLCHMCACQC